MSGETLPGGLYAEDRVDALDPQRVRQAPDPLPPAPGFVEGFLADWRLNQDDEQEFQISAMLDAYGDVEDALVNQGRPRARYRNREWTSFLTPNVETAPQRMDQIWADVEAARAADPRAFNDLPATRAEFDIWARGRRGGRARDQMTSERAPTGTGISAGLAYGLSTMGDFTKPENVLLLGGGSVGTRTVYGLLARETATGAIGALVAAPRVSAAREAMGEQYTGTDLLLDATIGGLTGATVAGGMHYGGRAIDALRASGGPETVSAGETLGGGEAAPGGNAAPDMADVSDADLAKTLENAIAPEDRTPEVQAALHVLQREGEVEASNPFAGDNGLDAHSQALADAMATLADGGRVAAEMHSAGPVAGPAQPIPFPNVNRGRNQPRGFRNNNPGNIIDGDFARGNAGYAGQDGRFARYQTMEQGVAAMDRLLGGYMRRGRVTVAQIISRWAPRADNNDTGAYISTVARAMGVDPNARLTAAHIPSLRNAMIAVENGAPLPRNSNRIAPDVTPPPQPVAAATPEPPIRAAAMDVVRPEVRTSNGTTLPTATIRAADIGVDAGLMQFKSGGDAQGVTERLRGVGEWDPVSAGMVTVWQANDGRLLIADGHQRHGLATRIMAADPSQDISLNAIVLREADGFSARDARVLTAIKNIAEGTGSPTDAAKVFRDGGQHVEAALARRLPPASPLIRDGKAIASLSDEAFGAVVNEVIPESHAAAIGQLAPDPATHMAMVELLHRLDPPNRRQAEGIVRQAVAAGFHAEEQIGLFGAEDRVTALFAHRARILDRGLTELRKLKGVFKTAADNAGTLEQAGSKIAVEASSAESAASARALAIIEKLAYSKGHVADLLNAAAERLAKGEPLAAVVRDFVRAVRELDLEQLLRGTDDGGTGGLSDAAGSAAGRGGRDSIAPGQDEALSGDLTPDELTPDQLTPATLDELEAAGQAGFGFFDPPEAKGFDDPLAGAGPQQVADSVWHDLNAEGLDEATMFDLGDGSEPRRMADIAQEIDSDMAAIDAARRCM